MAEEKNGNTWSVRTNVAKRTEKTDDGNEYKCSSGIIYTTTLNSIEYQAMSLCLYCPEAYMLWKYLTMNKDFYEGKLLKADLSQYVKMEPSKFARARLWLTYVGYLTPKECALFYDEKGQCATWHWEFWQDIEMSLMYQELKKTVLRKYNNLQDEYIPTYITKFIKESIAVKTKIKKGKIRTDYLDSTNKLDMILKNLDNNPYFVHGKPKSRVVYDMEENNTMSDTIQPHVVSDTGDIVSDTTHIVYDTEDVGYDTQRDKITKDNQTNDRQPHSDYIVSDTGDNIIFPIPPGHESKISKLNYISGKYSLSHFIKMGVTCDELRLYCGEWGPNSKIFKIAKENAKLIKQIYRVTE